MAVIHVDYAVLSILQDVMNDEYPVLLDTFLSDSAQQLAQLHLALAANEPWHALGMAAHSFKGSSGNMGAVRLAELCKQLEDSTRGHGAGNVYDEVRQIEEEFVTVRRLFSAERQRFSA